MIRRVLVTRPQPGADETAARLLAMGLSPVVMPLTRIVPLPVSTRVDPASFDAVAITSVNAVRHAPADSLASLTHKPVFAVGDASASAAREAGFVNVQSAAGTARELAALMLRGLGAGARVIHPVGRERTPGFVEALSAGGISLTALEVYGADAIDFTPQALSDIAEGGAIWGALALSPRAGKLLAGIAARPELAQTLSSASFFCISQNAAAPFDSLAAGRVFVSDEPTEDSVLLMLGAAAGQAPS